MEKIKAFIKTVKELGHFYILLVPERSSRESKSRRLSPLKLFILMVLYSAGIGFLSFVVLRTSPIDGLIFGKSSGLSSSEIEMVTELDKKMKLLSEELENLRAYNYRLKNAIGLADSTLLDNNLKVNSNEKKIKAGGNIFAVFKELFSVILAKDEKSIFFRKPVNGFISRDYYPEKGHQGLDFIVKTGTPVYAAANGFILFSGYTEEDGYKVIISHPENYISIYKHCSYLLKKEKDKVLQGELIALSGNTGYTTTGPHLHFEIWENGKPVNPKNLLIDY